MRINYLHFMLIVFVLQIFDNIEAAETITTSDLLAFYENELNLMGGEFTDKTKILSEKLLNEIDNKNVTFSHNALKELKISIQHFLRDFGHIKRFKLYQPLLTTYLNIIQKSNINSKENDLSFQQEFGEIVKSYYADITKDIEANYQKNIKENFLLRLEEFYKENDTKDLTKLKIYISDLKSCKNALCFPLQMDELLNVLDAATNSDVYLKYGKLLLNKYVAFIYIRIYYIGHEILKSAKLSELDFETRENLIKDINEFTKEFDAENDIDKMLAATGTDHFIKKYYTDKNLSQHNLLQEIFDNGKLTISGTEYENEILRSMFELKSMLNLFPTQEILATWLFVN